jgi:hypothetical protein
MKSIIFLVLSVTIIFPLAAQTMATTDDGQRVQLNGNRTWQYAPETLDAELHPVVANLVGTETVDMYTRHSKAEVQYPFGYLDLVFRFENTTDVDMRAFRGKIKIINIFGDEIFDFDAEMTDRIPAGEDTPYIFTFVITGISDPRYFNFREYSLDDLTVEIEAIQIVPAN